MKVKDSFVLRKIAGSNVVVPIGSETADFNGMMTLNETGAMLFGMLNKDRSIEDLTNAMLSEYDVSAAEAEEDVKAFVETLEKAGMLA